MDTKEWEAQQAGGGPESDPNTTGKRYMDFDEFFQERKVEPLRIKVYGVQHELPGDMPAMLMLRVMRAAETAKAAGKDSMLEVMTDKDVIDMAEAIFGQERLDAWAKKGLGIEQMGQMVEWCSTQYQATMQAKAESFKTAAAKTPSRARRR